MPRSIAAESRSPCRTFGSARMVVQAAIGRPFEFRSPLFRTRTDRRRSVVVIVNAHIAEVKSFVSHVRNGLIFPRESGVELPGSDRKVHPSEGNSGSIQMPESYSMPRALPSFRDRKLRRLRPDRPVQLACASGAICARIWGQTAPLPGTSRPAQIQAADGCEPGPPVRYAPESGDKLHHWRGRSHVPLPTRPTRPAQKTSGARSQPAAADARAGTASRPPRPH